MRMKTIVGDEAMTDDSMRNWMIQAFKDGRVKTPESIMADRIRLKITPRIVREQFDKALKEKTFRIENGGKQ